MLIYGHCSGFSGFSGFPGFSGFSGFSGFPGFSGFSGFSGFPGFSGFGGLRSLSATDRAKQARSTHDGGAGAGLEHARQLLVQRMILNYLRRRSRRRISWCRSRRSAIIGIARGGGGKAKGQSENEPLHVVIS